MVSRYGRTSPPNSPANNGIRLLLFHVHKECFPLNIATSLTFPSSFARLKDRSVGLDGEAYFEVAKDKAHPFIVKSAGQQVDVLGTHFNINCYTDESSAVTTLAEGSVKIAAMGSQPFANKVPG